MRPAASPVPPPAAGPWLLLELARGRYAVAARQVAELGEPGPLRRVPLAPPGVLGVTEWRGRLLTVLDLGWLLGDTALDVPPTLLRLAPPLGGTALWVPGRIGLGSAEGTGTPEPPGAEVIEPATLVRLLERRIVRRARHRTG